jgi:uncharacterized membrane protein
MGGRARTAMRSMSKWVLGVFVVLLALLVLQSIFSMLSRDFPQRYDSYLLIATAVVGALTFWLHRNKLGLKSDPAELERLEEVERKNDFEEKFPGFNNFPVIGWFGRWMYKEGWVFSVGLILLVLIGGCLRLADLDNPELHHDEFFHSSAAKGYLETGDFVLWDYVNDEPGKDYTRSSGYTWILAQSTRIFGFDEFGLRVPGAIVGTLTIVVVYFVFKAFASKDVALLAAFIFTFNEIAIYLARFVRGYSMLPFFYLMLAYVVFKGIEALLESDEEVPSERGRGLFGARRRRLLGYFVLGALLFLISVHLHYFAVYIIPVVLVYFPIRLIIASADGRKNLALHYAGYLLVLFVGFLLLITGSLSTMTNLVGANDITQHLRFDLVSQPAYYHYLFGMYKAEILVACLALLGAVVLCVKFRVKGLYVLLLTAVPLVIQVYLFDRFEDFRYVLFLIPFAGCVIAVGFTELVRFLLRAFSVSWGAVTERTLLVTVCTLLLLGLVIYPSFPGVALDGITHTAQASWVADEGKEYIHRRAVAGDLKKAYGYVNEHVGSNDALVVCNYMRGSLMYLNSSNGADVYVLQTDGTATVRRSASHVHLHDQDVIYYLTQAPDHVATNRAPAAGIKQYNYTSYFNGGDFYWPNVFLLRQSVL